MYADNNYDKRNKLALLTHRGINFVCADGV